MAGAIAKNISTGIKVKPEEWSEEKREVVKHPNAKLYNQKIRNRVAELDKEFTKAELLGVNLTKDRVKSLSEGNVITTDFFKHCEKWLKEKYKNPDTRKAMMSDFNKIHAYAPSLQFGDITAAWLKKYHNYLTDDLGQEGNTPWKAMKFIRTMLYDAQSVGGIVQKNPYQTKEYKMPRYEQPEKDGLYLHELDKLEELLHQPHPVIIKIMTAKFLFMCYTGLRISDAKRFDVNEHLQDGARIVITSKKTKITTNLKVYKRLENILRQLKELPEKGISDQKLNDYLKVIQELACVNRLVFTTHLGRHTFGCLLAEMGVTMEEAMELMGVKNKSVVRVYYKLRQPQIDRAADKLNAA